MRLAYCAYLDLLGIGERLRDRDSLEEQEQIAREFNGRLDVLLDCLNDPERDHRIYFAFTDNVFVAEDADPEPGDPEMESAFGFLIGDCCSAQYSLSLEGQLLRGGFDIGYIEESEYGIIGSGLIRAYKLETEADLPRILVSERIAKIVSWHLSYYGSTEFAPHSSHVIWCGDNRFMINYLSEVILDENEGPNIIQLEKHKEVIKKGLSDFQSNSRIRNKYVWLSAYHDWYCGEKKLNSNLINEVGDRYEAMFRRLNAVLPAATKEEVSQLRMNGKMMDLIDCPKTAPKT